MNRPDAATETPQLLNAPSIQQPQLEVVKVEKWEE